MVVSNRFLTIEMIEAEFSEMMGEKAMGYISPLDHMSLGINLDHMSLGIKGAVGSVWLERGWDIETLQRFRDRYLEPMAHALKERAEPK